jgi:hypothetical protein
MLLISQSRRHKLCKITTLVHLRHRDRPHNDLTEMTARIADLLSDLTCQTPLPLK